MGKKIDSNYLTEEYVEKIGSVKDDFESEPIYRYERKKKVAILKKLLKNTKDRCLDFGCSNGSYYDVLSNTGFKEIFGIDISKERLRIARDKGYYVINANGKLLPFNESIFNTIICIDVLVNILKEEDWKKIIKEFYRILENNGTLIFSIPNKKAYEFNNKINRLTFKRQTDLSDYNAVYEFEKIEDFLKKMNFTITHTYSIMYTIPERIARFPFLIEINELFLGKILGLKDYGKITYIKAVKK